MNPSTVCILDGHFSHLFVAKIVKSLFQKTKINGKEAGDGQFFLKECCISTGEIWSAALRDMTQALKKRVVDLNNQYILKKNKVEGEKFKVSFGKHFADVRELLIGGQSYKNFTIINYDSRVIIWGIFKSGTTLES